MFTIEIEDGREASSLIIIIIHLHIGLVCLPPGILKLISNQKYNLKEPENKEKHSTFIKRNYICLFKNENALSLELTRINPDWNIFSIKCGTNIYFFLQRFGLSSSSSSPSTLKNYEKNIKKNGKFFTLYYIPSKIIIGL